ncbi:MAG: hypothetical protein AB8B63_14280 [Granulosicoccus sp.]
MNGKEIEPSSDTGRTTDIVDAQAHDSFDPPDVGHPGAIRLECLAEPATDPGESS